jgi:hypothetical protein
LQNPWLVCRPDSFLHHHRKESRYKLLDDSSIQGIAGARWDGAFRCNRVLLQEGEVMKRWFFGALFVGLTVSMSAGHGASPAAAAGQAASGQLHGVFTVELAKSLDSKKLKEGDEVDAKVAADIQTGDGGTIPRGTKLTGHVTEAKARSKGDAESTLGIVFDKMSRPGAGDRPIKSIVQAAAPNPKADAPAGGVSYGALSEAAEKATFPTPAGRSVPILNEQSRGVLGIKNLQLGPNGVFTSSGKEVKLDSGMQILLDVTMQ